MNVVSELLKDISMPKMVKVKQVFPRPIIKDVRVELRKQLEQEKIAATIKPGMTVALTAGSRGIANIALILKETVTFLKEKGARPFIIPAMGSHGGATAEGQLEVLRGYNITEEYCGCKILSSMDVQRIGTTREGHPVVIDKYAAEADAIVILNRIKPHTAFRGPYESGLMKMMAIGLAKRQGADTCHEAGMKNMAHMVPLFGNAILENSNVLFGVALLENSFDETCEIIALEKAEIAEKEPTLLVKAKELMPKILFENIDVLVVNEIGKNFSGDGMDPNISGTFATEYASGGVNSQTVAVLDLSEETHGNGVGFGMADVSTRRAFEKFNFEMSYPNALTCLVSEVVKAPMILANDRECIAAAIKLCIEIDKKRPKIVRINNTLSIEEIYISEALLEEAKTMANITILSGPDDMVFDENGNLVI
jgi:hypothetical protein